MNSVFWHGFTSELNKHAAAIADSSITDKSVSLKPVAAPPVVQPAVPKTTPISYMGMKGTAIGNMPGTK